MWENYTYQAQEFYDDMWSDPNTLTGYRLLWAARLRALRYGETDPGVEALYVRAVKVAERGNLNADKIFAYLRYTEKEKLLFVLNFDFEHTHSFRLHIGEHAFQTMGSPLEGTLYISELFEKDFVDNFSMDEVLRNGLPISILPNSALIFRLEWR